MDEQTSILHGVINDDLRGASLSDKGVSAGGEFRKPFTASREKIYNDIIEKYDLHTGKRTTLRGSMAYEIIYLDEARGKVVLKQVGGSDVSVRKVSDSEFLDNLFDPEENPEENQAE